MKILLSNDDGILAPGLAALHAAVADLGETTVYAPRLPQSATGHSITLKRPLQVQRLQLSGTPPFWAHSVDGRPADCVRLAVRKLLPDPPDVVLTGINEGANVGVNVFYSGTVAAAAEAAMLGIPAVAFSAAGEDHGIDYERAGTLCRWVLDRLLATGLRRSDLISVNLPALDGDRPLGVRLVRQSTAELEDFYHQTVDHHGRESYRLGDDYSFAHRHEDSDVTCLAEGYITITPLHVDMTLYDRMDELARPDWPDPPD